MKQNNPAISKAVSDIFKPKGEAMPTDTSEEINLVYDVSPQIDVILTATATDATSATILTTPTDRDFYILMSILSTSKSSGATALNSTITAVINGVSCSINRNIHNASASANVQSVVSYPTRLKIDRGTAITVTNSTNVTFIQSAGTIFGYYVE